MQRWPAVRQLDQFLSHPISPPTPAPLLLQVLAAIARLQLLPATLITTQLAQLLSPLRWDLPPLDCSLLRQRVTQLWVKHLSLTPPWWAALQLELPLVR